MAMSLTQARLPKRLIELTKDLVKRGYYSSKSDVIRHALRKLVLEKQMFALDKQIGSIPNTGDSVKEVREIRKILSPQIKSFKDLEKINKKFENFGKK